MKETKNRRILIIDDQDAIREDFRKVLGGPNEDTSKGVSSARAAFFGADEAPKSGLGFELQYASQGDLGVETLRKAVEESRPFAMAFVDIRMPPGPDGLQTIKALWDVDPDLEVVICTAYSDYTFEEIVEACGETDRLLILKKPFDPVEVRQLAGALTSKWNIVQRERSRVLELEEANRRAEAASRAKSDFLANMSHEIRTPMNAILGYIDLLCDPATTPEERDNYSDTVRKSGKHLLTILSDILDISKIEACRMVMEEAEAKPLELAGEVIELMRTQAEDKELGLELDVRGRVPRSIHTDAVRVRQVLLNLIGNAIKFTSTGSVKLLVEALPPAHERDVVRLSFSIIDTGVGVREEDLEALFQPFVQADSSVTRTSGGTGLGLAISRRLALLLGGEVKATSRPGEGSTFVFVLPVGPEADIEWTTWNPGEYAPARPSVVDQTPLDARILIVEDVRVNQALIAAVLRKAGATISLANNGREGCDSVKAAADGGEPFDLVLMDMQMPVLDGYAATRELREAGISVPIVALTAHAMEGDRDLCLQAGCNGYLTKPIDRPELLRTCRAWVVDGPPSALPTDREAESRVDPAS